LGRSFVHRMGTAALAAALAVGGAGCANPVAVEIDPLKDFALYRTWGWLPPPRSEPARRARVTPELDSLLRGAIERELEARGFARAAEGERPDLLVSYHLELHTQLVVRSEKPAMQTLPTLHGGRGDVGAYEIERTVQRVVLYEVGLLGLDVADGLERELVWRGIGRSRARNRFSDRAEAAVAEIFERFPTGPAAR
jgi:hypothetical protein